MTKPTAATGRVYIGMSALLDRADEVYDAIRDECRALGLWPVRGHPAPDATTVTPELRELILGAQFWIFELTSCPPHVRAEFETALEAGCAPERMLFVARAGSTLGDTGRAGLVLLYRSLEDLKRTVHTAVGGMAGDEGMGDEGTGA